MNVQRLRRACLLGASLLAAALAGCGSSTIESAFTPNRVVAFGDTLGDLGQKNGQRYTINDGSVNVWSQQVASSYGQTLQAVAAGGRGYAQAHARVSQKPDAAGDSTSLTLTEQISAFLAGNSLSGGDLVLVNAGITDVIAQMSAFNAGSQTEAQMISNLQQAGRDLATQVQRLVDAGAKHVAVAGSYNLALSPWAAASGKGVQLQNASSAFNQGFLIAAANMGANVLYIDAAFYFNLLVGAPTTYGVSNVTGIACSSVDSGTGIGIGTGQVNSGLCNSGTITSGIDPAVTVFADKVYFTPIANRLFGGYAYQRIRARW